MLVRHGYGVLLFDSRGRGGERGRPEHACLGGRARRAGRAGVPEGAARRRSPTGSAAWASRSAAKPSCRRRPTLMICGRSSPRAPGYARSRSSPNCRSSASEWIGLPHVAILTAATALYTGGMPPGNLIDLVERIAPRPVLLIHAGPGQGGEILNADLRRGDRRERDGLGDQRRRPHEGAERAPGRVRAAGDRLLRPGANGEDVTGCLSAADGGVRQPRPQSLRFNSCHGPRPAPGNWRGPQPCGDCPHIAGDRALTASCGQ